MATTSQSSANQPSASSALCTASVSYKKNHGVLTLTRRALTWTPSAGGASEINVASSRMSALFASKEGSAKVMLKITVFPSSSSTQQAQAEDAYSFAYTSASSAISDREYFKRELGAIIAANRERLERGGGGGAAAEPSVKGKEKERDNGAAEGAAATYRLRKLVLTSSPALAQLHRELVIGGDISEAEFWEGREDLVAAVEAVEKQKKGRSGEMVDPRPETSDGGEVTVKITPALIREIFEEYPAVLKAYDENVPEPLDEHQFWTRYFQSKLFNRNRTTNRAAVNTIKDDVIFDRYLGEEDDELEPKNLQTQHIYRLLDLAATQDDQHDSGNRVDITMRAGAQRASLPLMRRFNEHSERLLNQSLGEEAKRSQFGPDPGNAGARNSYYDDIVLSDLNEPASSDRIMLNLQDRTKAPSGAVEAQVDLMADVDFELVIGNTKRDFESWEPNLGEFYVDHSATGDAVDAMTLNIQHKSSRAARDHAHTGGFSDSLLRQLTSVQASANEFLRQFWSAVLPAKANDLSATALASPTIKAGKAERMKACLEKMEGRMRGILDEMEGEERGRVEAALQPVREALLNAIQFYNARTT